MKHCIFIFLCCAAIACHTSNDNPVPAALPATTDSGNAITLAPTDTLRTDSAIALIRKAFQQINAMPLKSQQFKFTAESCNDEGTATYYLDNKNNIVKVMETGVIGDGGWTSIYYYQNGSFVFGLDTLVGGPAAGPAITTVTRKYVYNNKVIRTMEDDVYTTPIDSILTPSSREYKILEAYTTKNFGAAFCQ